MRSSGGTSELVIDLSMPIPYYTFSLTVYIHDRDWRDDTALMSMWGERYKKIYSHSVTQNPSSLPVLFPICLQQPHQKAGRRRSSVSKKSTEKEQTESEKTRPLEKGHIYFFYRPKVRYNFLFWIFLIFFSSRTLTLVLHRLIVVTRLNRKMMFKNYIWCWSHIGQPTSANQH